jgi:HlyD family type I secretion membrane fusion protein
MFISHLLGRQRRDPPLTSIVSAFESETQAVILGTSPRNEHTVLYALMGILALGLALISVAKVDIVVTSGGRTATRAGTLYVRPLDKSIVRQILVHPGDEVKAGQPLATLDSTIVTADVAKLQQTINAVKADLARLQAEQAGTPFASAANDPYEKNQVQIYEQRQANYRSTLANYDSQINAAEAQLRQSQQDAANYAARLKVNADVAAIEDKLEAEGWGSRVKSLAADDQRLEVQRLQSFSTNQIAQTQHNVEALRAQRAAFIDQWQSDVAQYVINDQNVLAQSQQDLDKARLSEAMVNVLAPTDAYVLSVGRVSVGTVVDGGGAAADPLFTLTPLDTPLDVELDLNPKDTGFVHIGDMVDIKLDAYRFTYYGTAKGVVKTVSDGSFTLDENNQPVSPYYKVYVTLTDTHLHGVPPDFHLVPGMTLTGDVIAGRRTILSYIIEGVTRTNAEAMREP